MLERYLLISWPEVQKVLEHKRGKECIKCIDTIGHPCPDCTYAVSEDLYMEVYGTE